jgi:hypothetical protein
MQENRIAFQLYIVCHDRDMKARSPFIKGGVVNSPYMIGDLRLKIPERKLKVRLSE